MQLQERWEEYVEHTRQCYSPEFWELHHVVKEESVALRNALFTKVRELTQSKRSQWPTSVRGMRERVNKRAGCFFDFVQYVPRFLCVSLWEVPLILCLSL